MEIGIAKVDAHVFVEMKFKLTRTASVQIKVTAMAYMFLLIAFGVLVVRRRRKIFHKILKPAEIR